MNHQEYGAKLPRARQLRSWGFPPTKIAGMLDVSPAWVRKHTEGLQRPTGQPRKFDYDKAIRMLQYPANTPYRVAKRMRVHKNTIYSMINRMLESTVEDGGQF